MQEERSLTTTKVYVDSSQQETAYNKYRDECIELLNKLMNCPKQPATDSGFKKTETSGDKHEETSGATSEKTPSAEPTKSSTPLQHNGKVGNLEDLIFFLIKSPTTLPIKTKLNNVYKIFNPNARDILSSPVSTTPVPIPGASKSRDEIIQFFTTEYENTKEKLNNGLLIGKPFFVEGGSPKNIIGSFETACLKTINDLKKTNMDKILFEQYPELLKAKTDALDKIANESKYNDEERTICLAYLDIWKKEIDKIIKETQPNP